MRKIEIDMLKAIRDGKSMVKQNTTVLHNTDGSTRVKLHGNHIADVFADGTVSVDLTVLRQWPSPTTKSRLRALGVPVSTKDGDTFIGDTDIHEYPNTYVLVEGHTDDYKDYLRRVYGI
jgi:hypothetical protein